MNIVIAGPGAIGCLLASWLRATGRNITLLDKDPDRARLLERNGIRMETSGGSRITPIRATVDPHCISRADLVLICVKAHATHALLERIAPWLPPGIPVVSLQNGIDPANTLARFAGNKRSVCAVTGHGATLLNTGHIVHAGSGITRVAPFLPECPHAARNLTDLLKRSGWETVFVADRQRVLWSKLLLNAGINPVTALAGVCNGVLLERQDLFQRALQAAREGQQVAEAMAIRLDYADPEPELRRICARTAGNISSMLQDVRRGKMTEIDAINGAIVRAGQRLRVRVPVNRELLAGVLRAQRQTRD